MLIFSRCTFRTRLVFQTCEKDPVVFTFNQVQASSSFGPEVQYIGPVAIGSRILLPISQNPYCQT